MSIAHLLKVSRLEGLTDGIFAIAMTILVLDLRLPSHLLTQDVWQILQSDVFLKLVVYAGSFILLGTLWVAMNFQLGLLNRLNRTYLWANVFYLMVICVVPFSASLIASYPNSSVSLTFYAVNLLCSSLGQLIIAQTSYYYSLNKSFCKKELRDAIIRRILLAPIFDITAIVVSHWHTYIAFALLLTPTVLYMFPGRVDKYEEIDG